MLESISCEKLIKTPIVFKQGLNAVVGADDAHNSIGKSSVLMLIDFAFGGSDFTKKCDDVIRNVGDLKVGITFEFDKKYSFIRDTGSEDQVYRVDHQDFISLSDFNLFLKEKYSFIEENISFRECVSGFFRIYQRNNYNDKRPLEIVSKEGWATIRKRILKMFGKYWIIENLEKEKASEAKIKKDIDGTFNSGAIKRVKKLQVKKNELELVGIDSEIKEIKLSLKSNVTNIHKIINEKSLALMKDKNRLVDLQLDLKTKLLRVESSLSNSTDRSTRSFNSVVDFFPEIDKEKLEKVAGFHSGITRIMKKQLQDEKRIIVESLQASELDIKKIDADILDVIGSKEESLYLLERLMELDRLEYNLRLQNEFWYKSEKSKLKLKDLKDDINNALSESVNYLEQLINESLKFFIEKIYADNPIAPKLIFKDGDYLFDHGDDRGTGKGFANMICLDLTFLYNTMLPCLIHDSVLFKNMDVPSIEKLISIYSKSKKQIFIAIDETLKYRSDTQDEIESSMFLKLDENNVAFKKKWKKVN